MNTYEDGRHHRQVGNVAHIQHYLIAGIVALQHFIDDPGKAFQVFQHIIFDVYVIMHGAWKTYGFPATGKTVL